MCDVLVVEDEPALLGMFVEALREEGGLEVCGAPDADAALAAMGAGGAAEGARVLVTDLDLGRGLDGFGLAEEAARRRGPALARVVYATGRPWRVARRGLGPRERVLAKPFHPDALLDAVRGALRPPGGAREGAAA